MWNLPALKTGSDIFKAPYKPEQNIYNPGDGIHSLDFYFLSY